MSELNNIDLIVEYPEFSYKVWYRSKDSEIIEWSVSDESDDLLMEGVFKSNDYYRSTFNIIPSKLEENTYESLFYLYFENIKLKCIDIVEFREDESEVNVEGDYTDEEDIY